MPITQQYGLYLLEIMKSLPEEKALELLDFAKFLAQQYGLESKTQVEESVLLWQEQSLAKIWDNPEEDVYELSPR